MTDRQLKPRYDTRLGSRGGVTNLQQPGRAAVHSEDLLTPQGLTQFPPAVKGHMSHSFGNGNGEGERGIKATGQTGGRDSQHLQ